MANGRAQTVDDYLAPVREVALHVDAEREKDGWDAPHELYAVIRRDTPDDTASVIGLLPVPAWRFACENCPNISDALRVMCIGMENAGTELKRSTFPQRHLYGAALVAEAWMLKAPSNHGFESDDAWRAAQERQIHKHKDRIEIRFVHVAPILGEPIHLVRERGGKPEFAEDTFGESVALGGEVPPLLTRLAQALVVS